MNRRSFLASTACLSATLALAAEKNESKSSSPARKKRIKLGIATYSYWHFKTEKVPIETVIDKTSEIGVEGLDILHRQMDLPDLGSTRSWEWCANAYGSDGRLVVGDSDCGGLAGVHSVHHAYRRDGIAFRVLAVL